VVPSLRGKARPSGGYQQGPLGDTDEGAALTAEALNAAIEFLDELLAKRGDEDPAP
jgi:hypothetical protein